MEATSTRKYIRMSRRKIARLSRAAVKKQLGLVKAQLAAEPQEAARQLLKSLKAAEAAFQQKDPNADTDKLFVKEILVTVGPSIHRMMPRARGSADVVIKRSSHIKVILSDLK